MILAVFLAEPKSRSFFEEQIFILDFWSPKILKNVDAHGHTQDFSYMGSKNKKLAEKPGHFFLAFFAGKLEFSGKIKECPIFVFVVENNEFVVKFTKPCACYENFLFPVHLRKLIARFNHIEKGSFLSNQIF